MYNFHFQFNEEHGLFVLRKEGSSVRLVPYDACGTNQLKDELLLATFIKGLCRPCVEVHV